MSLVDKVKNEVTTFGDVAADLHGMVCKEGMHSNNIIFYIFITSIGTFLETL